MMTFGFSGWFQCRLATDPDPFNEPRGKSGWTFAFPGEPDLDRIIRFQNPVAPRSHGPIVGVSIRSVTIDGNLIANHPLIGAPIELIDKAVFAGEDGKIATSAQEPIVPYHVNIKYNNLLVSGFDPIDLTDNNEIKRRQPINFESNSPEVKQVTGITDYLNYRKVRRESLQTDFDVETDPVKRSALEDRIKELVAGGIRVSSLGFKLSYQFVLRGPNTFTDPQGIVGEVPSAPSVWTVNFWMGAWDADALSGFTLGSLTIS